MKPNTDTTNKRSCLTSGGSTARCKQGQRKLQLKVWKGNFQILIQREKMRIEIRALVGQKSGKTGQQRLKVLKISKNNKKSRRERERHAFQTGSMKKA